jgi:hypothetical protein
MKTLAARMAQDEARLDGEWCGIAKTLYRRPAIEQYKSLPAGYFLRALRIVNRQKAMEVIKALGGQVADLLDGSNPIKVRLQELAVGDNIQIHRDWYYATKVTGKGMAVEKVVMGTLARMLLGEDLEPTKVANEMPLGYIETARSCKEKYGGKPRNEVTAELDAWMRSQVTEEEFCNGLT